MTMTFDMYTYLFGCWASRLAQIIIQSRPKPRLRSDPLAFNASAWG